MPILRFTVDSALLSELGEKLVESPHIALVELVKNAYDADASTVSISINPHDSGGPTISVRDNGSGMTLEDVRKYWMRIATTHKVKKNVSPKYGRPRTGSKGIGRFACRRLGTELLLKTTAKVANGYETTDVTFPWLSFHPGDEISQVECPGTTQMNLKGSTGTTLTITGSEENEWRKRGFDYLKRQLAILTANRGTRRPGYEEDPGFNVTLSAPGFEDVIENLRERLITAGWGDLSVTVDQAGQVKYHLSAMKVGKRSVTHPERFPYLYGVAAKIGILPEKKEEIRRKDVISKGSLKPILEDWGGVYIRYKGFRIYPYGEPSNDWLMIDRDRGLRRTSLSPVLQGFAAKLQGVNPQRALLSLLSSRAYIGDVMIGEEASDAFEPKASREGFLEDEGMRALTEIVRFGIDWSTIYREYSRAIDAEEEAEVARAELEEELGQDLSSARVIQTAINVVRSEVKRVAAQLPTAERQEILRSVKRATDTIEKREASNEFERRHLQLIASTSSLLLIFSHEVKSLLSWFEQVRISLAQIRRSVGEPEAKELSSLEEDLGKTKDRFLDLLGMTSLVSIPQHVEPTKIALRPRLERAIMAFALILNSYGISVDTSKVGSSIQVGPMLEAEVFAILLNLLSNAIKSVIAGREKRIQVDATRKDGLVNLHIRDTGLGLKEKSFDLVFRPFIADPDEHLYPVLSDVLNPEDKYIVGAGSGLGLSITREIIEARGGKIRFVKPEKPWRADVEVLLP